MPAPGQDRDNRWVDDFLQANDQQKHGLTPQMLQRLTQRGSLVRLHNGLYAPPLSLTANTPEATLDLEHRTWMQRLAGHLHRGGATSAISHRAAGEMHGLEGVVGRHDDISVALQCGWKTAPAIRATLETTDVVRVDGLRVTSIERTLADLGRFLAADQLEFAVEHALRGEDRRRPDIWNEALLTRLLAIPSTSRRPGLSALRIVLVRRGTQRPTGSYAETEAAQGLRKAGVVLVRQPTILIFSADGRLLHRFFPDFADLVRGLLVEINGRAGHIGDDNIDRDDRRLNELSRTFQILRFSARQVHRDPVGVARSIGRVQEAMALRTEHWSGGGATVRLTTDGAHVWHH